MVVAQLLLALESPLFSLPPVFVAWARLHSGSQCWLLLVHLTNDAHQTHGEKTQLPMKISLCILNLPVSYTQ